MTATSSTEQLTHKLTTASRLTAFTHYNPVSLVSSASPIASSNASSIVFGTVLADSLGQYRIIICVTRTLAFRLPPRSSFFNNALAEESTTIVIPLFDASPRFELDRHAIFERNRRIVSLTFGDVSRVCIPSVGHGSIPRYRVSVLLFIASALVLVGHFGKYTALARRSACDCVMLAFGMRSWRTDDSSGCSAQTETKLGAAHPRIRRSRAQGYHG